MSETLDTFDADFVDQDAESWLRDHSHQAEIDIDRILIERFGLRMFIQLAWGTVESVGYKSNWHIDAVCLPADAMITTREGPKAIGDIVEHRWVGEVLSFNHQTNATEWRPVRAWMKSPASPMMEIKLSSGESIVCTANHPVFIDGRGYIRADLVAIGDASFVRTLPTAASHQETKTALLRHDLLRGKQEKTGGGNVPWMRTKKVMGRRPVPAVPRRSTAKNARHEMPRLWIGGPDQPGAMGSVVAAVWRVLRSSLLWAVCERVSQPVLRGRGKLSPIRGRVSQDAQADREAGLPQVLPVLGHPAPGRAPHRLQQGEQRGGEPRDAVPPLPRKAARQPSSDLGVSRATVVSVERSLRICPTVFNIEVAKNNNYFAGGILVHNCEHLEAVSKGQIQRLIINIPPRSMKSVSVAVMWPAWDWIKNPWRRYLFSSYAYNLALRDSVRCRQVIRSPWYTERFGDRFRLRRDQNTKRRFDNDHHGYRLSTSVDSQLTGEGGDFVVVDDPHNVRRAESPVARENTLKWWDEAMQTRVNDMATGAFVIIQQRVHENDLVGHVLSKPDNGYTTLCLPAEYDPTHPQVWARDPRKEDGQLLWPAHISQANLDVLKISLGSYAAAAQLQQRPSPREGGLFKAQWFTRRVKVAPGDCSWVRAWDWAASEKNLLKADPDWTATCLLGWSPSQARWYVGHVARWRESPGQVRLILKATAETDRDTYGHRIRTELPQDPGSAGKDQVSSMVTDLAGHNVRVATVTGDKALRAEPVAAQAEIGNIVLVIGDWNEGFISELCSFPTGSHDDRVDAFTHAFNRMTGGRIGILDFYADQVRERQERDAQAKAAADLTKATGQGNEPPLVINSETRDMGEGMRPSRRGMDEDDE